MSFQYGNCIETGASIPTDFRYYKFRVPNADWIIAAALGQFLMQVAESGWYETGGVTVADAAEAFQIIQESVVEVPSPVGSIVSYASALPISPDLLGCDGASYLRSDYPELFAAIGTVWGAVDIAHFNVPDLRGRAPIGDGLGPGLSNRVRGQSFGEETHTLTVTELASHAHAEGTTLPLPVVVVPADGVAAVGAAGTTGATGGDGAHNNMQPSAVIVFGIVAR